MHTLRIKVKDSVYDQFQHFLEKLPKDDIQVLADDLVFDSEESVLSEESVNEQSRRKFYSISLKTKGYHFDREEAHVR